MTRTGRRVMRRVCLPLTASLLLCAVPPATAFARRQATMLADRAPTRAGISDRVVGGPAPASVARAGEYSSYATASGDSVAVRLSSVYGDDTAVAQSYVDFLGGLPHGSELSLLKLSIETPSELTRDCGGGSSVAACYLPNSDLMIVPGEQAQNTNTGTTTSYLVAHEYGHHVAAHRSNTPFGALDYGPKYWASQERVCAGVANGRLFPGAETSSLYFANPGENWAETYARLKYPDLPWTFTSRLKPTSAVLAAARRDVAQPWTGPVRRVFRGTFGAGGSRARRFKLRLRLDGSLSLRLRGPAGTDYDLRMTVDGKQLAHTQTRGSRDALHLGAACRTRSRETVTVTVVRRSGSGPYRLDVSYAG